MISVIRLKWKFLGTYVAASRVWLAYLNWRIKSSVEFVLAWQITKEDFPKTFKSDQTKSCWIKLR